jgi:hypothetical protein
MVAFGVEAKRLFQFDSKYLNVNHGSFGSIPTEVHEEQFRLLKLAESNTDLWFRKTALTKYKENCAVAADILGINENDVAGVVLVKNTSYGVTSIVRSLLMAHECGTLTRKTGPKLNFMELFAELLFNPFRSLFRLFGMTLIKPFRVVVFSFSYIQVKQLLKYFGNHPSIVVTYIEVSHPYDHATLVKLLQEELEKNPCDLVIFDAISSVPALILPVEELTKACHSHGALVLVDAAHLVGQIHFNFSELKHKPDFMVTNAHKWLYLPRGCAIVYVSGEYRRLVVPSTVSRGYYDGTGTILDNFEWTGTDDMSQYCMLDFCRKYRQNHFKSEEHIIKYTHLLAVWTGLYLSRQWNTEMMFSGTISDEFRNGLIKKLEAWLTILSSEEQVEEDLLREMVTGYENVIPAMVNIRLPQNLEFRDGSFVEHQDKSSFFALFKGTEGNTWIRLSCQVFNTMEDYKWVETQF